MATAAAVPIIPPYTPELLPSVQARIEDYLLSKCKPDHRPMVMEFGSGWSTLWFAKMECLTISAEHDEEWWKEVGRALTREKIHCVYPMLRPVGKMPGFLARPSTPIYDLVLIDCIDEERIACLEASILFLREGGWLVLDDSHWDILQPAFSILGGWHHTTLEGMHTRKLPIDNPETCYHRTTIFIKP